MFKSKAEYPVRTQKKVYSIILLLMKDVTTNGETS
jgi:hypothetical protein